MSADQLLHFVLLPHLAQGHLIPMVDVARLLARRGLTVTIITTPLNASRFRSIIKRAASSGLQIHLLTVPFPSIESGLPECCESMDSLPNRDMIKNLLLGIRMLQEPVHKLFHRLKPRPSCIIADKNIMWADSIASDFEIPRIVFDGTSCFSLLCTHNIVVSKVYETVSETEPFVVPGLPDRVELTRAQLPNSVNIGHSDTKGVRDEIRAKEHSAYGVIVNTFEELEPDYVAEFRRVRGDNVWCIGPVSLLNEDELDKAERGDHKVGIDPKRCMKWLDLWGPNSVIYACLGSMSRLTPPQLIELGLGLEASGRPFVWVVKGGKNSIEFENWVLESGFEERVKDRALIVKGWAPQVLILSHPSIGCFLTHCGWNSTLEGLCSGVPMITWPMFAEQFYNEKMIVQILKIGVRIGSEFSVKWGDEEKFGVVIRKEAVERAVSELMGDGEEGRERRRRSVELKEKAKTAVEEGGSSFLNLTLLIEDMKHKLMGR